MSKTLLDRLDSLIEEADLEHQIASLQSGNGNRDYESTLGALNALCTARNTLRTADDATSKIVVGHIVRNIVRSRLFGFIPLPRSKGPEWLHIGDLKELENPEEEHDIRVSHEVVGQIEGTRQAVLKAFLERQKKSR